MRCECVEPGYCPRFGRQITGRLHQICSEVDCDPGTSAHYRALWAQEYARPSVSSRAVTLRSHQNPGDVLCMTAAIRSLHLAHPGWFRVSVDTPHQEVFLHSPDIVTERGELIEMHYPAVHQSAKRGIHFMQAWCEHLSEALGVSVPLLTNRPVLHFATEVEKHDGWLVCSGVKEDFTTKRWNGYQEVVDSLPGVRFLQVGTADHAPLRGVKNLLGRTTLRQLFDLARGCRGILCGVSLLMHVAAAVEVPSVVVAGAREPVQWNAYPKQHYLHTLGMLPCGQTPCWKMRVENIGPSVCEHPEGDIPRCMTLVTPGSVVSLIERLGLTAKTN